MKRVKFLTGLISVLFAAVVSLGFLTYNRVDNHDPKSFSTENVTRDIRIISKEHHSILHPEQRADVREYLAASLRRAGGAPQIFMYDSIPSKFGSTFDAGNVYCCFNPYGKDIADSYILLMAHMDSRFYEEVRGKRVLSYGAADDGYGLGIILELVRGALQYRGEWKQGIKVLFTDAEEHELDGIRLALEKQNHIFDNVGLVINIEARGVKGPALLFETSEGNSRLLDFYTGNAQYPYTYSLTSAVYRFMPNFTDFTWTRPLFPGYNFSVIDGYECYHTDLDNFSNINTKSIGHYGAQIQPLVHEFLTNDRYADPHYFRAGEDKIAFTVPGITTFLISRNANIILNAVFLVLFLVTVAMFHLMGRIRAGRIVSRIILQLATIVTVAAIGTGIAWISAKISGTPFSLTATRHVPGASAISYSVMGIFCLGYIAFFLKKAKKSQDFVFEHIFAALAIMIAISAVLLFTLGDNFFLMFPVACATTAMFLHMFVYMNIFSLPATILVSMTAVSFLYNILTALTIGSLGIVLSMMLPYMILTVSLFYCFMVQKR